MQRVFTFLFLVIAATSFGQQRTDLNVKPAGGTSGGVSTGGGLKKLGTPSYGLTQQNDSTYSVDSASSTGIVTKPRLNAQLGAKLDTTGAVNVSLLNSRLGAKADTTGAVNVSLLNSRLAAKIDTGNGVDISLLNTRLAGKADTTGAVNVSLLNSRLAGKVDTTGAVNVSLLNSLLAAKIDTGNAVNISVLNSSLASKIDTSSALSGLAKLKVARSDTFHYAQADGAIVWYGTSITLGNSTIYPYASIVSTAYRKTAINRGIGGTFMRFTSAGDSSMVDRIYTIPKKTSSIYKIFFEYGTNDAANTDTAGFRAAYNRVLDSTISATGGGYSNSDIVLLTPHWRLKTATSAARDQQYVNVVKSVGAARGITVVDQYAMSYGHVSYLNVDSLHFNSEGQFMAALNIMNTLGLPKQEAVRFEDLSVKQLNINGDLPSTTPQLTIQGTAQATANNQTFYGLRVNPSTVANGFTGGITYGIYNGANYLMDPTRTIAGLKADGITVRNMLQMINDTTNVSTSSQPTKIIGNPLQLDYRGFLSFTNNNSGSRFSGRIFNATDNWVLETTTATPLDRWIGSKFSVASTTQGSIPFPKMTRANINALTNLTRNLWVQDSTLGKAMYWDGTVWRVVADSASFSRASVVSAANVTMAFNTDYLNTSATQYTYTLPATAGFATNGSAVITILATGTGGFKIVVPNGYSLQTGSTSTLTNGTGYVTGTQGQKVQIIAVGTNSFYALPLSGTLTVGP